MKNTKKGFTLVELLVVIAIVAILATVAIIGYTSFTRKADISNDTVIAGELNTLLAATDATDPIESFDDVKAALYANGFYLANLNTKTEGCYFVWDKANNQIILVDGNDNFKVLFSKTEPSSNKADWHFAVSDLSKVAAIEAAGYNVEKMVTDVATLKEALAAGGEFHIDTSLVLDSENILYFDTEGVTTTLNLGSATLHTNGILDNVIPVVVNKGSVTFNGGVIGTAGSYVDMDGDLVNTPISTKAGTNTVFNGTVFNIAESGFGVLGGNASLNDVTINSENIGMQVITNAQVEFVDTVINSDSACMVACDHNMSDGVATATIKSGTYTSANNPYAPIYACGGKVVIEGGSFNSADGGKMFFLANTSTEESITITGGTFNGVPFAELDTVDEWLALCNEGCTVVIENGVVTITK